MAPPTRFYAILPYCKILLKDSRPTPYPNEQRSVGDHLKRRRYELGLRQIDVAKRLSVDEYTICQWENNKTTPAVRYYPRIIEFVGYDPHGVPQCVGEEIAARRRMLGLSRKSLAKKLGLDEATVERFEKGTSKPTGKRAEIVRAFLTT